LTASTINVRLSAVRKLIGEARRNGILDAEQAGVTTPNVKNRTFRFVAKTCRL
jgi:hypothetical protein